MLQLKELFVFDSASVVIEDKSEMKSLENFTTVVRTKFNTSCSEPASDINDWISKFSETTCTNWIVWKTFPQPKRYVYRKLYKCQHSCLNKSKKPQMGSCRRRNLKCDASISVLIKITNKNTIKNDIYLKQGLNAEIKVRLVISLNKSKHALVA